MASTRTLAVTLGPLLLSSMLAGCGSHPRQGSDTDRPVVQNTSGEGDAPAECEAGMVERRGDCVEALTQRPICPVAALVSADETTIVVIGRTPQLEIRMRTIRDRQHRDRVIQSEDRAIAELESEGYRQLPAANVILAREWDGERMSVQLLRADGQRQGTIIAELFMRRPLFPAKSKDGTVYWGPDPGAPESGLVPCSGDLMGWSVWLDHTHLVLSIGFDTDACGTDVSGFCSLSAFDDY